MFVAEQRGMAREYSILLLAMAWCAVLIFPAAVVLIGVGETWTHLLAVPAAIKSATLGLSGLLATHFGAELGISVLQTKQNEKSGAEGGRAVAVRLLSASLREGGVALVRVAAVYCFAAALLIAVTFWCIQQFALGQMGEVTEKLALLASGVLVGVLTSLLRRPQPA